MHCPNIPPDVSGGGKQAITLATKLSQMGYEIIFLANRMVDSEAIDRDLGFEVIRMKGFKVGGNNLDLLNYWFRVFVNIYILRKKFDIMHCHGVVLEMSFSSYIAKLLGKKSLLKTSLEGELNYLNKDYKSSNLMYKLLKNADKVIAISKELIEEYRSTQLPTDRVKYIPNGVDVDIYKPVTESNKKQLAKELNITVPANKPIFVYHGVIMGRKSILWVVEQLKDYLLEGKLTLMVIGDPSRHEATESYYRNFKEYISNNGLEDKIVVRGFKEDVYKYLQISDAYVTASLGEGLSNSLLEAMAVGLFPIASRTSGTSQVITHGKNGFMFDCLDEAQFKSAVDHYLKIYNSDEENQIRTMAIDTIDKHFSIDSTAKKYADLYERLCS